MKKLYTFIVLLSTATMVAQDLFITVSVPPGTTACRLSGPWWGWDPNGGPGGVDNGNDTFTFTPAPTENMEYLYTINGSGSYENLIDNAQAAECTDRVNNGNFNTDYFSYANRIWKATDALIWNEIYDSCSEATLSIKKVNTLNFSLHPNPTKDSWTVKTNNINISSIEIYDILGKNVLSLSPKSSEAKINGTSLRLGLYFAQIKTVNGINSIKLLRE